MNKINLVFGLTMNYILKNTNLSGDILQFNSMFETSDITNINNYEIKVSKEIYGDDIIINLKNEIKLLNKAIDEKKDIRIWTSHYEVNSYVLLLYICDYLKNKNVNIYVIFSDEYKNKLVPSPECFDQNEIIELLNIECKLSKDDINNYSKEWIKIKDSKADLRILENKEVKLVSFDYYNDQLLNILKDEGEIKVVRLIALFMKDYYLQDSVVAYLISRLIKQKKIKVTKQGKRFFQNIISNND